jgi:hypothetical protein
MTTPTGRDNGLPPASRYVALVDVDPPVADHVLEILRDAGVTAVAEPLAGDRGPARETPPPQRPTERVHVDVGHLVLAREVVGHALPALRADFHADAARRADAADAERERRKREELAPEDVDSLFAGIVASFDQVATDPVPRWPVTEDTDPTDQGPADPAAADSGRGDSAGRPPLSSRLLCSRPADDDPASEADLEGHFVPPPPPPLPETDRITRLAWAAMLGGPGLLVIAALLNIGLDRVVVGVALIAFLGGFGTLIARMRDRPPQDDGWDDGAVL